MSIVNKRILALCALGALIAGGAMAQAPAHKHDPSHMSHGAPAAPVVEKLTISPELKKILTEEMVAIQAGMAELIPAIAAGDAQKVADIGAKMEASYIMAQKLTPKQMEELHKGLPAGFVAMDEEFHYFAGMLTHAAYMGHWNMIPSLASKLMEGCVNCHGTYATEKFPELKGKVEVRQRPGYAKHEGGAMHKMGDKCAMDKMGAGHMGGHMHGAMGKDCAMGDKPCPMDAQGNCIKDKCDMAKKGECPMMKHDGKEHEAPAAKGK